MCLADSTNSPYTHTPREDETGYDVVRKVLHSFPRKGPERVEFMKKQVLVSGSCTDARVCHGQYHVAFMYHDTTTQVMELSHDQPVDAKDDADASRAYLTGRRIEIAAILCESIPMQDVIAVIMTLCSDPPYAAGIMSYFHAPLANVLCNGNTGGGGRIPTVMKWLDEDGVVQVRGGGVAVMFPPGW